MFFLSVGKKVSILVLLDLPWEVFIHNLYVKKFGVSILVLLDLPWEEGDKVHFINSDGVFQSLFCWICLGRSMIMY